MRHFKQDLLYSFRQLGARKLWSAIVVVTLALGIGLNTAVFSALDGMLFRPLPGVENADQLILLYRTYAGQKFGSLSVPDSVDLRERTKDVFSGFTAWKFSSLSLTVGGEPRMLFGAMVAANYFDVLGVRPALGRTFLPEEDQGWGGANPVIVLSHGGWQRYFGADPNVVGQKVVMNGRSVEVIGVASPGFRGALPMVEPALWAPLSQLDREELEARGNCSMAGIGRLAPGVTLKRAEERLRTAMADLRQIYPDNYAGIEINSVPQSEAGIHPMMRTAQVGLSAAVMSVVSLLLLIACVNVANLFLARARDRSREIAVRLAIGASRGRLIAQLLTESLLFAFVASGVGLGVALLAMRLANHISIVGIDFTPDLHLSPTVLLFTLGVTIATDVLCGLLPAWQSTKPSLVPALKGGSGSGARRSRTSRALVMAQMALSVVLLVAAGLFLLNLRLAETLDKGFATEDRLVAGMNPELQGYDRPRTEIFYTRLGERLRAHPGVKSVAFIDNLPLGLSNSDRTISVPGYVPRPDEGMSIQYSRVSPGYFETMGIRMSRGRAFGATDTADSAPAVIVNQNFADRFWPSRDPLGRIVRIGRLEPREFQVVGVVPTGKYQSLGEAPRAFFYMLQAQEWTSGMVAVVHTDGAAGSFASTLRAEVRALDPNLPLANLGTLEQSLGIALLPARLGGSVLGLLGILGLGLASIGIYGVMAHSVAQRTREIGIRIALGSAPREVAGGVLREGLALVGIGAAIGVVAAFGVARMLESVLYGAAGGPLVFTTVLGLLLAVSAVATWMPALRAASVDPLVALRQE